MGKAAVRMLLEDTDGSTYRFDNRAFDRAVRAKADKKAHITLTSIKRHLADTCHISEDSIKKWMEGRTGPSDRDLVKDVAAVLEMDYHDLLTPVLITQEGNHMENRNQTMPKAQENGQNNLDEQMGTVVKAVYGSCVSLIYTMEDHLGKHPLPWNERLKTMREACAHSLREGHLYIDQNAVVLHSAARYTLHRILLELSELVQTLRIPERWETEPGCLTIQEMEFLGCHSREVYLSGEQPDDIDCRIYLVDEINLAENLGFGEIVEPTEEQWDRLDSMGDLSGFGYNGCITPSMIAVDQLVSTLSDLFRTSFPEIFG